MNISLIGYGKMGKEIEQLCIKKGYNIYSIVDPLLNTELEVLKGTDLAIEFTQPTAAFKNVIYCLDHHIPVVCGTTGWDNELDELKNYCLANGGTMFYSSNFSIGVNVFWKVSKYLAALMDQYADYELGIHEIHHNQKKDAPSGTAVTLAQMMISASQRYSTWEKAESFSHSPHLKIPISSERTGIIPGHHTLEYKSAHDRIEFTHEAFSRGGFVAGVVAAAAWVKDKKGYFEMEDLLSE